MMRLMAVGDLMLGDSSNTVGFGVHSRYPGSSVDAVFAEFASCVADADVVIGNLECPLTPVGVGASAWARDQTRGDPAYAAALRRAGFTAISVGNNHAMQHGEHGFRTTVAALRDAGLAVVGLRGTAPWACKPLHVVTANGTSATVLGYSWRPRQYGTGTPPYADAPLNAILDDIRRAAISADYVIVSLHWGDEFVGQPSAADAAAAGAMLAAGARGVIGHHPHVTRPVVIHNGGLIAFSLGNAVSDMLWMPALREGYLLDATFGAPSPTFRVLQLQIDDAYRIRVRDEVSPDSLALAPLDDASYREAVQRSLTRQRAAQYAYLLRNAGRLAPGALRTLVATTARNKWRAVAQQLRGAR